MISLLNRPEMQVAGCPCRSLSFTRFWRMAGTIVPPVRLSVIP